MKKIITTMIVASLTVVTAGLLEDAAKEDVKKTCDVKANGLAKVLDIAKKYNPEAIKLGVEFKRLGIKNREYIKFAQEAIKAKKKETIIKYKSKGKDKTKKFATEYATWRACTFAIRALQQKVEAEKTWRMAVPGDGYKY
jgi:hypothetical protein